jgi:hypothetical protein
VIPGYPGTPQILLDIERGALDARAQGIGSLMAIRRDWVINGYIKIWRPPRSAATRALRI